MDNKHLDEIINLPEIFDAQVSDDGRWVVWEWAGISNSIQIYAARTDESQTPIRLTETDQNVLLRSITPDSSAVIVAQDTGGDERVGLYRVRFDNPGNMEALTDSSPDYYIKGGELQPDGHTLVYGANADENGQEIEPSWIYCHDLSSGTRTAIVQPETSGGNYAPKLSPDGCHVLYVRKDEHPASRHLWLVNVDDRSDREIVNPGNGFKAFGTWLDANRLLVLSETASHYRVGVYRVDKDTITWLVDDPNINIEALDKLPGIDSHALVVESRFARKYSWLMGVQPGELTAFAPDGNETLLILGKSNADWIGMVYSSTQPFDIIRIQEDGSRVSLSQVWEYVRVQPDRLIPAEDYRWQSVDGLEVQGWLYRARGEAIGTIVWVHGGPTWHSEDWINPEIQYYAASGFNVLDPNYRGSTGFSRAYREAIKVDGWGGREQDDIRTGIEKLIADGIAEPGKIGITGLSYGGYSTWCAITRFSPDLINAAVPVCGMTDLIVDYETTRPDLRPYSAEMLGGTPEEIPEKYRERSPIYYVQNIRGRLMIVQGMRDPNVTPQNVTEVENALQQANIPYELLSFDDEGHGIERKVNQAVLYRRIVEFFREAFS